MGRITKQTPATTAPLPITHFTHPHPLHPTPSNQIPANTLCSGCRLQSYATMYTCQTCSFILHQFCAELPKQITHPCHVGCTLSLLTVASYAGGAFSCDACSHIGNGWSYHCTRCDYDLHVSCASKPLKFKHQAHGTCELDLTFKNPYPDSDGFYCDICGKPGLNQWLYRCHSCEFDVHLDCTAAAVNPPPTQPILQHHQSLPAAATSQFHQPMIQHHRLLPAVPTSHFQQNQLMHGANNGSIHHAPNYSANRQIPGLVGGSGQVYGYAPMIVPGVGMGAAVAEGGLGSNLTQPVLSVAARVVTSTVLHHAMGNGDEGDSSDSLLDVLSGVFF